MCKELKEAVMRLSSKKTVNKDLILLSSKTVQELEKIDIKLRDNSNSFANSLAEISDKLSKFLESDIAFRAVAEERDKNISKKIDAMMGKLDERAEKAAQMDLVEGVAKNKWVWIGLLITVSILIGLNASGLYDKILG